MEARDPHPQRVELPRGNQTEQTCPEIQTRSTAQNRVRGLRHQQTRVVEGKEDPGAQGENKAEDR